jgi:hypothetical protein
MTFWNAVPSKADPQSSPLIGFNDERESMDSKKIRNRTCITQNSDDGTEFWLLF